MTLFAEVAQSELAIRSSIDSLGRIFVIVLALAIGEAFKQFVSDKAEKPEDRQFHWDRVFALVAFVALVVPFSHGMARYFFEIYQESNRPRPYWVYLLIDSVVFTIESVLFFVLSRSLPRVQWQRFYFTVVLLLLLDIIWGSFAAYFHTPAMWNWVLVNCVAVPLFVIILIRYYRQPDSICGLVLATIVAVARTVADYWFNFEFYFPPQL